MISFFTALSSLRDADHTLTCRDKNILPIAEPLARIGICHHGLLPSEFPHAGGDHGCYSISPFCGTGFSH
jgi:hypothetical protein